MATVDTLSRTAAQLGLKVPPELLAGAAQVIE
jgi:hypothetical protein